MMTTSKALLAFAAALCLAGVSYAADESENKEYPAKEPEPQQWSWTGPLGHFDRQQLQRGFQVYKEVCSACHGLRLVAFRNLGDPGGPEFTAAQVKAIAAGWQVQVATQDDKGEQATRPPTPADRIPGPYANEKAARAANGGALPPDLSVIIKAREGGANYVHALITGYSDPPADFKVLTGLNYNPYFDTHQIAMPPPLSSDGQVTYASAPGNWPATKDHMAQDVVAFLAWAAEPKMEERKQLGVMVMLYLFGVAGIMYAAYKRLWRDVDH